MDTNQLISPVSEHNFGDSHIPWRYDFYTDGKPKKIMLIKDVTINDITYKRNSEVIFYPNGILKQGVIAKNVKINELEFKKGDKLQFDNTGKIQKNK